METQAWREKPYWQEVLPQRIREILSYFYKDIHPTQDERLSSLSWVAMEQKAFPEAPYINVLVPESETSHPETLDFIVYVVEQANSMLNMLGISPEEVVHLEVLLDPSQEDFLGICGKAAGIYHLGQQFILSKIHRTHDFLHEVAHWVTMTPLKEKLPKSTLLVEGMAQYLATQIHNSPEKEESTLPLENGYNEGSRIFSYVFPDKEIHLDMEVVPIVGMYLGAILVEIIHSKIDPSRTSFEELGRIWKTLPDHTSVSDWINGNGLDAKAIEKEWKMRLNPSEEVMSKNTLGSFLSPLFNKLRKSGIARKRSS